VLVGYTEVGATSSQGSHLGFEVGGCDVKSPIRSRPLRSDRRRGRDRLNKNHKAAHRSTVWVYESEDPKTARKARRAFISPALKLTVLTPSPPFFTDDNDSAPHQLNPGTLLTSRPSAWVRGLLNESRSGTVRNEAARITWENLGCVCPIQVVDNSLIYPGPH
jgi:hypothetical protein